MAERSPKARKDLGHTAQVMIKLHPDLMSFVEQRASVYYCSRSEYIRRLIVEDRNRFHGQP